MMKAMAQNAPTPRTNLILDLGAVVHTEQWRL
jgi:hypothetical protein